MNLCFFDSSGLTKRYLRETGSSWVSEITDAKTGNFLYISGLARVEVISAIKKKERAGDISYPDAMAAINLFRHHLANEYQIIEVDSTLIELAMELIETYPLRAYDAMQLATALIVNQDWMTVGAYPLIFISADDTLNAASSSEGLRVDNPNLHP